jgi:hypothetical protein
LVFGITVDLSMNFTLINTKRNLKEKKIGDKRKKGGE